MRLRSSIAVALSVLTVALAAPGQPASATTGPILVGMTSPWVQDSTGKWIENTAHDDAQIGGGYRSGVISTFFQWDVNTTSLTNWLNFVRGRGAAPMVSLYPPTTVTLSQIAAGNQDATLKKLAASLKAWNHPILFRLFPEMTLTWHSYAPGYKSQTPAQFIAAWRHVVNLFTNAGANGVYFVWNPNRITTTMPYSYKQLWPGASYVDWVGLDGYAWQDASHGQEGPYTMFKPSVDAIRAITTTKPLLIAETGVNPYAGKATWLKGYVSAHQALGAKISLYFNKNMNDTPSSCPTSTTQRCWRWDSGPNSSAQLAAVRTAFSPTSVKYAGRMSMSAIDHLVWAHSF